MEQEYFFSPSTMGFYFSDIHDTMPEDVISITLALWESLLEGQSEGKLIMPPDKKHSLPWLADPPLPTPEEQMEALKREFTNAIQKHLDTFAHTRGYDNALSCASYVTSTIPQFAVEAQYMVQARDATWDVGYDILNAVLAGKRPVPTWEEVAAELPVLVWPDI